MFKLNLFQKMVIWVVLLVVPILLMNNYSNYVSLRVVQDEIRNNNMNRLTFFVSQLEATTNQIAMNAVSLMSDPDFTLLKNLDLMGPSEKMAFLAKIQEKLKLQSVAGNWISKISLYFPDAQLAIPNEAADVSTLDEARFPSEWHTRAAATSGSFDFSISFKDPVLQYKRSELGYMLTTTFSGFNLVKMLNEFKSTTNGDPFFYRSPSEHIANSSAKLSLMQHLHENIRQQPIGESGNRIVALNGKKYWVFYVRSDSLGWYLIDYIPLEDILSPIAQAKNLFFGSIALLLLIGFVSLWMLYRKVQIPIKQLVRSFQRMKAGDYSERIRTDKNSEFDFLNVQFNRMAAKVQELIEHVYREKLRSKESQLKQLQAQINPHFLYNCLNYIHVMMHNDDKEAASAMIMNLGSYYRHTIRLESPHSSLKEEMNLVGNYLEIQRLRMPRLDYEIRIPESMMDLQIPRLLVQPIVENAVVHGIDRKRGPCLIRIDADETPTSCRIRIEDNGAGMEEAKLLQLIASLADKKEPSSFGLGVWNVHQRLVHQFGEDSGLTIGHSSSGGIVATLAWSK